MKFALQSISSLGAVLLGFLLLANVGITSAGRGELESLSAVERAVITETIQANGTVVEVDELTTLVKSQLVVDTESQADLPYNSTLSKLEVLEAYTITPKGEKILVASNAIRTVEDDNSTGAAMFSDQKHKIIIFPKVTPGSKTYYKTKLTTFKPLLPGYFYTRLTFSPNAEVLSYEYNLNYPEDLKLYKKVAADKALNLKKEQARVLYNWVSRNIRYVAIYLGDGGIVPHDATSILKNRYGDCKDHNALLIALLAAKGINASSALINSGVAYTLPKYPVLGPFNHIITYIPAWDLYLDSTAEMAPFGTLPSSEIDKPTLLTKLAKVGHTPQPKKEDSKIITGITMQIEKDGRIKGKTHTMYFGGAEINARYRYEGAETTLSEMLVRSDLAKFRQTGEGKITTSYVYDLNEPFTTNTEFTLDAIANVPGPGAIAVPVGLAPGELALIANDRPPEKFTVPYTCATKWIGESYKIGFPSNAKVTRIPPNTSYKKGGIEYESTYEESKNVVSVTRVLKVQRPSAVCQPEKLQKWKDFYQVFIKDIRSQIFYD